MINDSSISINGIDGSGKSTQIRLLELDCNNIFHFTKPLNTYSDRWTHARGIDMSKWWFEEISPELLTEIIIESLNKRNLDRTTGKIQMLDRGWRMFKAVCVATWITRDENISIHQVINTVDKLFSNALDFEPNETELLLNPDATYFQSIESLMTKIKSSNHIKPFPEHIESRYARYQKNLRLAMANYFTDSDVIAISIDMPICDIHEVIRKQLSHIFRVELPILVDKLDLIIGFSGLSESGKSSFAEQLRLSHTFTRLKLRYFIELLEKRNAQRTNEEIVMELILFIRRHYYIDRFSIESLHDPYIPAILKLMLGDKFKIVYINTERDNRINRTYLQPGNTKSFEKVVKEIDEKDDLKRLRGIMHIPEIADILIDNDSSSFESNFKTLLSELKI